MTLPGECVNDVVCTCEDCGTEMEIDVHHSAAGYYIGFFCPNDGPYSRESSYYPTYEAAEEALNKGTYYRM